MLSLHDLHPESAASRVETALAQFRGTTASQGVEVDLLEVSEDGVVKLALKGASNRMRSLIEDAVVAAAPDIAGIIFEAGSGPDFVPIASLLANHGPASTR